MKEKSKAASRRPNTKLEFERLVRSCSIHELEDLSACGVSNYGIYEYHPESKCASPASSALPWPVEFLLTKHHVKHRFADGRPLTLSDVNRCQERWKSKVRWSHYAEEHWGPSDHKVYATRTDRYLVCPHPSTSVVETAMEKVSEMVLKRCGGAVSNTRSTSSMFTSSSLVRWGIKLWKESSWTAFRTDKVGGFAIFPKTLYHAVCKNAVRSAKVYRPEYWSECLRQAYASLYMKACKRVGETSGSKKLGKHLLGDLTMFGSHNLESTISGTIKTHEDPGDVVMRVLHNGSLHPFRPGM